ncbi:lytic transglycosylase domain-containing protein [Paenibacillus lignilyticus]|uniref:Lytic transglycosylase domain-containing protein n=1 Tax=Paenibacillus lignilyticus TaxID=1172615 RepID=A0ABS5CDZ6_9BACL|nr:lytic transglycosylase domain-containing protein [Paenibacillus lignilyticus]MBP3964211.1 lytic transglycosylase domain-containing protein [Paenibacillus lignilyticus]
MSIDPRIMKSLLQLQLMPSLDLNGNENVLSSASGQDGSSMFDTLLQQYMAGGTGSSALADMAAQPGMVSLEALSGLVPLIQSAAAQSTTDADSNPSEYDAYINAAASKYGIDPVLIKAVIHTESSYNPNAESSAGAKGLMQLMDGTARGLGVTDSFDPQQNIEGGTKFLAYLMRKYDGNEQTVLAAYNAGPGRVDRAGIKSNEDFTAMMSLLPHETQRYVAKVQRAKDQYDGSI